MYNKKISIIIPIMNEEGNIKILINELEKILNIFHDRELIFVDDGSCDNM